MSRFLPHFAQRGQGQSPRSPSVGWSLLVGCFLLVTPMAGCTQAGSAPTAAAEQGPAPAPTATSPTPNQDPALSGFAISEVLPVPLRAEDPSWIELRNFGEAPVRIAGWRLADKTKERYVFPDDLAAVPAGDLVVVYFGGPAGQAEDRDFADDHCVHLYAPAGDPPAFRDMINECALYQPPKVSAATLVDFVLWGGNSETQAERLAVEAGLTNGLTYRVNAPPGEVGFAAGCSLGRVKLTPLAAGGSLRGLADERSGNWDVYPPTHLSPGEANLWGPPIIMCPLFTPLASARGIAFGWALPDSLYHLPKMASELGWTSRLQISGDPGFTHPLVDEVSVNNPVRHALAPGRYYWRVRVEHPGEEAMWSETRELVVKPRPPDLPED